MVKSSSLKEMLYKHTKEYAIDQGYHIDEWDGLLRCYGGSEKPFDNWVIDLNVENLSSFQEKIKKEVQFFSDLKRNFEWKFFNLFHPDWVLNDLKNFGFEKGEEESLFLFDLKAENVFSHLKSNVVVRQIQTPDEFYEVGHLLNEVWNDDFSQLVDNLQQESSKSPEHVKIFGAFIEGHLASVGWIRMYGGLGYLFGGSTRPKYRKQGAFSALIEKRAEVAIKNSCRYLIVDASDESAPILNKLGFEKIGITIPFTKNA